MNVSNKIKKQLIKDLDEESDMMNGEIKSWKSEVKSMLRALELHDKGIRAEDIRS